MGELALASRPTPAAINAVKRRFMELNDARLARTRHILRPRQRDFLDLLPLLFHVNHPALPGFVSSATPAGIPDYQPSASALAAAKRHARDYRHRGQGLPSFAILALYFMGSPGTVAFSQGSDFDIWLCHDPELGEAALDELQRKASAIERWADGLGLEVHFFLVNSEQVRTGEQQTLSDESSGSAQHSLLLDEFYRTGLLLAGRYPLWWLVPPEHEHDYEAYVAKLRDGVLRFDDFIDFGGLARIPAEEFFGAAVWQLYKGIDSPYKSVLKLSLIEAYAADHPTSDLLCLRLKKAVYRGEQDPDRLDPYLMMQAKIEEYLASRGEAERLELTRRCLYFKLDKRLSEPAVIQADPQGPLLAQLIHSWGWSQGDLAVMDSRNMWKIQRVSEERRALFDALSASYRFLSSFARQHAGLALINQHDLNVLGRKLYAAYERKAGKIELLNRGITGDLSESHLSFHQITTEDRQTSWSLFKGQVKPEARAQGTPLKRSRSLIELLAWCYFNGLMSQQGTVASVFPPAALALAELKTLMARMSATLPLEALSHAGTEEFTQPARVLRSALFVNVGAPPGPARLTQMPAAVADPLSFGSERQNLLANLELVLVTSWQEVLTFRYAGDKALMECLCEYLKWAPPARGDRPAPLAVYGSSGLHAKVAERVEQLFRDVVYWYYDQAVVPGTRYISEVGSRYYVLQFEGDTPLYEDLGDYGDLLRYLGRPHPRFKGAVLDRYALRDTVLPLIFRHNRPGVVQFFFRPSGEESEIYVVDERGSLFFQRIAFHDANTLLSQYSRFFEAVRNRINFLMQDGQSAASAEGVEYSVVVRDAAGRLKLEPRDLAGAESARGYLSLQVIVDSEEGNNVFTLYCGDREFSTLEYGREVFNAVVRHILELRSSGHHYPIYITDIGMSRSMVGEGGADRVQTIHFLVYKRRIEHELNRALRRLQ